MSRAEAVHVKARAVVRQHGHTEGETWREYKDWHIEIRTGAKFVSVWTSEGIVFLSMTGVPVFYRPGAWEQYLDRLFHRLPVNGQAHGPGDQVNGQAHGPGDQVNGQARGPE